ncbi:WXG100 family type VII secretion target [Oscillochloris sp. ZM17-4]|uniref:WXG100 family type VII secretion target n=1 Tax=Oscillochloris sp. ZM17-4 TaxID=2866714 RepID=UPI001C7317ED|nr:WXG100 family type VII secretion target [Oscillochloris sp. ZM17-4]MBX0331369.1 WXG100 family type VII secretion target [Oscillochloris sp. ZM17-4]
MAEPIIQANYPQLDEIARRFQSQASQVSGMLDRVNRAFEPLVDGSWQGLGATAFFDEMEGQLIPGVRRLIDTLHTSGEVTLAVSQLLRTAELEAAGYFQNGAEGEGGSDKAQAGEAGGGGGGGEEDFRFTFLEDHGLRITTAWSLFKDATKPSGGIFNFAKNAAKIVISEGAFTDKAAGILKSIFTSAPRQSFLKNLKDGFKDKLGPFITIASTFEEFSVGNSKEKGLLSREFVTATVADLAADGIITVASAAIQTAIPIPGIGIAASFGLGYLYDKTGIKDSWRGVVDEAGKHIQEQASQLPAQISHVARDISYAAQDTVNAARQGVTQIGDQFQRGVSNASQVFSGALRGAGQFALNLF